MLKIAIFVPNLEGGGAERMMVHLANEFSQFDICVDLVLAEESGPYLANIYSRISVVNLKTKFTNPLIIFQLSNYLKKAQPNALLTAMTYPNIVGIVARHVGSTPTRLIISERIMLTLQSSQMNTIKEKLKPIAAKFFYKQADQIVAISNGVAHDLATKIGIKKSNITTIYNPVYTAELDHDYPVPEHQIFKNPKKPIILGVGRLVPQKNFSLLLKAFAELLKSQDANLIILGEGQQRSILLDLAGKLAIQDSIYLPGYVKNPYAYMQHSSVFVLSSSWEGFGNVLVEAMACGCPVVSTACQSGPAEILDNGKYGSLVPINDYQALAQSILKTLKAPPPKQQIRNRAKYFSAKTIARKYLDLLLPDLNNKSQIQGSQEN